MGKNCTWSSRLQLIAYQGHETQAAGFAFLCLFFKVISLTFGYLVNPGKYSLWTAVTAGELAARKS